MRPVWKGNITFGLVNIPVELFPVENKSTHVHFHQIDRRDNARIRYKRVNAETGKEVPWEEIGKGYEYDRDHVIPVKENELEKIPDVEAKTINIESFVDQKNIQPVCIYRAYYLVPDEGGEKGYILLRDSIAKTGTAGIAKILLSTTEYLAAVAAMDNVMVVYLLYYESGLRKPQDLPLPQEKMQKQKISAKERDIAIRLVQAMKTSWKYQHYKDAFLKKFQDWLERKMRHLPPKKLKKAEVTVSPVTDFVALIRRSLDRKNMKNSSKKPLAQATGRKKASRLSRGATRTG